MNTAALNLEHASALVAALAASGLRHAVVSPGSRNTPLLLALAEHPQVQLQVVLDERVAGFVALGLARASGGPVALACTSGSAAGHYLPALMEASHSRLPLIVLTADRPPELHDSGAGQTLDQRHLFGRFVRRFFDLGAPAPGVSPRRLRSLVAQVVDTACGSPPGPVHVNVPLREPLWEPGLPAPPALEVPAVQVGRAPQAPSPQSVQSVLDAMGQAERGVIVCGPWWPRGGAEGAARLRRGVEALAQALGWPVLAEPGSQLRYGARGEAVIGAYDAMLRDGAVAQALRPDMVLRLGQAPTSKPTFRWLAAQEQATSILVDPDGQWHDFGHRSTRLVVADPALFIEALLERSPGSRAGAAWLGRWRQAQEASQAALEQLCQEPGPIWEAQVARSVLACLPEGGALHVASSMPVRDLDSFTAPRAEAVAVMCNRGANGIDGTISTALGQAQVWAQGPVALLTGDLAFLHDAGGLLASAQMGCSLLVVVINNGGGGIFGFLPIAAHPERFESLFITPQSARLAPLCQSAGAQHVLVRDREALEQALRQHLGQPGVTVVEVEVGREHNLAQHRLAWARVAQASQRALGLDKEQEHG